MPSPPTAGSSLSNLYTTVPNVIAAVQFFSSATNIASSVILQSIVWYEAEMNARLGLKYSVPCSLGILSDAVLEGISTVGAAYYTLMRAPSAMVTEHQEWLDRFKRRAEDLLSMLCTGSATLPISGQENPAIFVWSNTMNWVPTFWEGPLESSPVDVDKILQGYENRGLGWNLEGS